VYTEKRAARRSLENNIGFTTPSQMVSSIINLSRQQAEVIIVNIYSFFMCFFYAVGVYSFLKYFYPSYEEQISTYIRNHKELVSGLTVTAVLSVATEVLTRIINSAVWSHSIDSIFEALIAVWLPQMCIFFMGTCVNICCHIIYLKKPPTSNSKGTTENKVGDTDKTNKNKDTVSENAEIRRCISCDTIATNFSANMNVHIILPLTLTAYGIIYTAFPTFILMVTYPTQVIMIVPTAIALLFATVIFSAIMFKLKLLNDKLSNLKLDTRREKIINTVKF
jgi:hypothetical protein